MLNKRQVGRRPVAERILLLAACIAIGAFIMLYRTQRDLIGLPASTPAEQSFPSSNPNSNQVQTETSRTVISSPIQGQAKENTKLLVFVLGMHHSMTSVATKMLADTKLFYPGETHELLIRRDNPMKYWELRRAVNVDQIFFNSAKENQFSSAAPRLYGWLGYGVNTGNGAGNRDRLKSQAGEILEDLVARTPNDQATVIKDPRMSLTVSVWLEAAEAMKQKVRSMCVVMIRDPVESTYRFLADYNAPMSVLSAREWASIWEQYTWHSLRSCFGAGVDVEIVRHEDYARNPAGTTKLLAARLLRTDPSAIPDPIVPDKWSERHEKKEALWKQTKIHLPQQETEVLSSQGFDLWGLLRLSDLTAVRKLVMESKPPQWVRLIRKRDEAYVVEANQGTTELTLRVLRRSIQTFDSTRPLLLKLTDTSVELSDESKDGWLVVPCYSSDSAKCERRLGSFSRVVTLSGSDLVTGIDNKDDLILDHCPNGQCTTNQAMFDALANIGGRVSEVKTRRRR